MSEHERSEQESETEGGGFDVDPSKGTGGYRPPADPGEQGTPLGPLPEAGREGQGQPGPAEQASTRTGEDSAQTTGAPEGSQDL